jgi:IS66 Orf2 like protein
MVWQSYAGRNYQPILFPAACLYLEADVQLRLSYYRYDGQGFVLAQKRLSKGRFVWWPNGSGPARSLEAYQAQLLVAAGNPDTQAAPMWRRVS